MNWMMSCWRGTPLAVQGPMAEDVVAAVFGDWVRDIRFFWFADAEIEGIPVKIQRSGYSGQGGFEIYLLDGTRGVVHAPAVRVAPTHLPRPHAAHR